MIRRLLERFAFTSRPLQDRLAALIATAVMGAVTATGIAAYGLVLLTVYDQLDTELVDVASITSTWFSEDLENLGGLDPSAMRAANVVLTLVRADGHAISLPGRRVTVDWGPAELTIARTTMGHSARTGVDSNGELVRIVAVPLASVDNTQHYALVLARPLAPTLGVLYILGWSLIVFGAIGASIAGALGYAISKSGIQPIRQLSDAVARIAATNKLTPVEVRGDDEVADLGRTFNRMLGALESSRDRQRRLIADAGHDLRTPLTSRRTNVELLVADEKQGMLPAGARGEILRDVAAQLGEFTALVGDLVQLSREDQVAAAPEAIDLREVVESALARVKRRGLGIVWDVELNPLYLVGESDALERAVTNLLDNAVKFSPPGATVHVHLEGDRLRIADQGPGIADEDLPHVFERFYRSDKARTTPGSGLGLSIVAQTIQAHGGWVKAGRSIEGGAEFTVRLPGSPTPPEEGYDELDDELDDDPASPFVD